MSEAEIKERISKLEPKLTEAKLADEVKNEYADFLNGSITDPTEFKKQFRKLTVKCHPDRNRKATDKLFQAINDYNSAFDGGNGDPAKIREALNNMNQVVNEKASNLSKYEKEMGSLKAQANANNGAKVNEQAKAQEAPKSGAADKAEANANNGAKVNEQAKAQEAPKSGAADKAQANANNGAKVNEQAKAQEAPKADSAEKAQAKTDNGAKAEQQGSTISTEDKIAMGQMGNQIHSAKNLSDLDKLQAQLDKMPDCAQKRNLQKQIDSAKKSFVDVEPEFEVYTDIKGFKSGDKIPSGQKIAINGNEKFQVGKSELDLSSPEIQNRLKQMKDGEVLTIGREGDIKIAVDDPFVSRKHLAIQKDGDRFVIKDTSTNGTYIKGAEKVKTSTGVSDEIKTTFDKNMQERLSKLKNGQSASFHNGDNYYVVKNNNGQIVIETTLDANELVRVKGNGGKEINTNYIKTSVEARQYMQDAIASGQYTDSFESYVQTMNNMHRVSATGRNGKNEWYSQAGSGGNSVNPGEIRGSGYMVNHRTNTAIEAEEIAKQYGDSYRVTKGESRVKLDGIPKKYQPKDTYNKQAAEDWAKHSHYYPDGAGMGYYYKEMHRTSKEALNLINKGASEQKILAKIAEHYQYAANARPYGQINNSLFMNEINTLLQKAGMKTMPHGNLDQISMHLQPEAFQRYFIDQYYQTAL